MTLLNAGKVEQTVVHTADEAYSSWLFAAARELMQSGIRDFSQVAAYAVTNGPGSFTGVRVGLAAVKAWAEGYGRPIVALTRLEVLASQARSHARFVATCFDAHRGQVFGALFARETSGLRRDGDEMVGTLVEFKDVVEERAQGAAVAWISPDTQLFEEAAREGFHPAGGIESSEMPLAPVLGRLACERLERGESTDALHLDANYVRRCDAEILWKGPSRVLKRS
jgi:tRNA threonylcarbamoyladenosine biosynthesis protein TsaB